MVLLVSVKLTAAPALSVALFMVICPHAELSVTPVLLSVSCVTVPPAPVLYPIPAVLLELNTPTVAVTELELIDTTLAVLATLTSTELLASTFTLLVPLDMPDAPTPA